MPIERDEEGATRYRLPVRLLQMLVCSTVGITDRLRGDWPQDYLESALRPRPGANLVFRIVSVELIQS